MGSRHRNELGQVAVSLVGGLVMLAALTAVLLAALASAVPFAWQHSAAERARARQEIIGRGAALEPDWRRAGRELGEPAGAR